METLSMRWYNITEGRSRGITLRSPLDTLTATDVQNVMNTLVTLKVIPAGYSTDYASIINRTSNELFNLI
jgi:hypothetical protein